MLKRFLYTMAIIILSTAMSIGYDEGVKDYGCMPHTFVFSSSISKIIMGCTSWPTMLIKIVDPISTNVESTIDNNFMGNFCTAGVIDNGVNILVLLSETDNNVNTKEGILYKINYANGNIIDQLQFDSWPTDMAVDNTDAYAYVSSGIDFREYSEILKIDLDNLNIVDCIEYGKYCDDIEINHNGSKLYAYDDDTRHVGVIATSDMTLINNDLSFGVIGLNLKMGYDNRLFISESSMAYNNMPSIWVIDTSTDEIIHTVIIDHIGIDFIDINPENRKLYGLVYTKTHLDEYSGEYWFEATNQIIELNLDDYSYRYIIMGNEPLCDIAVAYGNGMNRLFCLACGNESQNVHYKDIIP